VLRILQEAVTNVLRHARATRIRVATRERAGDGGRPGVVVEVGDDGVGIAPGAAAGRGLANMAFRAQRLGGELRVGPVEAGPGTRVELWLPLAPARGARVSPGIP
jgi:signal transduction histidine kinase